jgi:hypothetical protein
MYISFPKASLQWSIDKLKIYLTAFGGNLYKWDFSHPRRSGKVGVPSDLLKLNWRANKLLRDNAEAHGEVVDPYDDVFHESELSEDELMG